MVRQQGGGAGDVVDLKPLNDSVMIPSHSCPEQVHETRHKQWLLANSAEESNYIYHTL